MKDMMYPASGAGSSVIAMITGLIDVSGMLNAFLFGIVGALGGMLVKFLWRKIQQRCRK